MNSSSSLDWPSIRTRASQFPDEAFEFVREGLRHSVESLHGAPKQVSSANQEVAPDDRRHISGQQLCLGLKSFAAQRYGMLAGLVLSRWGLRRTEDFGTIVYALIDRKELRASEKDSIEDFKSVFEFGEAFGGVTIA